MIRATVTVSIHELQASFLIPSIEHPSRIFAGLSIISAHLLICPSAYPTTCVSTYCHIPIYLPTYLPVYLPTDPPIYLAVYVSIYLFLHNRNHTGARAIWLTHTRTLISQTARISCDVLDTGVCEQNTPLENNIHWNISLYHKIIQLLLCVRHACQFISINKSVLRIIIIIHTIYRHHTIQLLLCAPHIYIYIYIYIHTTLYNAPNRGLDCRFYLWTAEQGLA